MSPPVGPAGCEGVGEGAADRAWLASVAASSFATQIKFSSENLTYHLSERSVAASFGRRFGDTLSLRALGGGVLDGTVERVGERFDVHPGWLAGLSLAGNWSGIGGKDWFLGGSLTIAVSSVHTTDRSGVSHGLLAQDNRVTLIFGRVFERKWKPYLVARGFFGPVRWTIGADDTTGTDTHHYAIGLGGSITLVPGVEVFAEEAYFGEQSLTAGAGFAF